MNYLLCAGQLCQGRLHIAADLPERLKGGYSCLSFTWKETKIRQGFISCHIEP